MRPKQHLLLLHPLFMFSLAVLLLNDLYLKNEFHNEFTGKLSDVAGLFAFPVFFIAFFPKYKNMVLVCTGIFFMWWKCPFSNSFIAFLNTEIHLPVHRVIDYTDYAALLIIPLAGYLKPMHYSPSLVRRIAVWCIGLISFFSFSATSMIRRLTNDNRVKLDKHLRTRKTESQIVSSIESNGLNPRTDTAVYEKLGWNHYYLGSKDKDGKMTMMSADSLFEGVYTKINYGSFYTIPRMYVAGDSIFNLQLILSGQYSPKRDIWLHSFEYKGMDSAHLALSSYPVWKKLKKPIKKKIKEIVR
jgi:hypothetical protein